MCVMSRTALRVSVTRPKKPSPAEEPPASRGMSIPEGLSPKLLDETDRRSLLLVDSEGGKTLIGVELGMETSISSSSSSSS
jgi:hypothetical protein